MKPIYWLIALMLGSGVAQAARDYPGSSDHEGIERFPLSYIVHFRDQEVPEYRLALGELEKINGVVTPEKELRISGPLKRVVYRAPDSYAASDPYQYFRQQLLVDGSDKLFECESRACGSSNYWANTIFRYSKLYGLERSQRYLAVKRGEQYLVLYSIKRGNKRVYTILDVIGKSVEPLVSDVTQLKQNGWLPLEDSPSDQLLQFLVDEVDRFWVLAAVDSDSDEDAGIARSLELAGEQRQLLVDRGVSGDKIRVHGVGGLMPLKDFSGEQVWIVIP